MSVYFIAQIEVHDPAGYRRYVKGFIGMFGNYRGEVIAADDNAVLLEGEWPGRRTVILRFDDETEARRWYESEEYQAVAKFRHGSATTHMVLINGLS